MINKEYDFSKFKDEYFIEFNTIADVYQTKQSRDKETNEIIEEYVLIKKDVKTRQRVYKSDISYVKEVFNNKGNVRTQRVEIGISSRDPIIVLGRYRDINECIFKPKAKLDNVGFKWY